MGDLEDLAAAVTARERTKRRGLTQIVYATPPPTRLGCVFRAVQTALLLWTVLIAILIGLILYDGFNGQVRGDDVYPQWGHLLASQVYENTFLQQLGRQNKVGAAIIASAGLLVVWGAAALPLVVVGIVSIRG